MATNRIGYFPCISPEQAQVQANAVEEGGGEVFSVFVHDDRWHVWYKFPSVAVSDRILALFSEDWRKFEKRARAEKKVAKSQDAP